MLPAAIRFGVGPYFGVNTQHWGENLKTHFLHTHTLSTALPLLLLYLCHKYISQTSLCATTLLHVYRNEQCSDSAPALRRVSSVVFCHSRDPLCHVVVAPSE